MFDIFVTKLSPTGQLVWSKRWGSKVSGWWGSAITWDVPIQASGLIPEPFMNQLAAVGKALGGLGLMED